MANMEPPPQEIQVYMERVFVPLAALGSDVVATARRARDMEVRVGTVADVHNAAEGLGAGVDAGEYERGHTALRAAAFLGWKASDEAVHVMEAVVSVLECAAIASIVIAIQRGMSLGSAFDSLPAPFTCAWREAAVPDDARDAQDEQADSDEDEEHELERRAQNSRVGSASACVVDVNDVDDDDDLGSPRRRASAWPMFLDGCDWRSSRKAVAKARTSSRVARSLALALTKLRALHRSMQAVIAAHASARAALTSPDGVRELIDEDAGVDLASAAGATCGMVRRLLLVVQRTLDAMHRAMQFYTAIKQQRLVGTNSVRGL